MTKLLRLGATGAYANGLDADLNGMKHPDLVPEAALPEDTVREGDEWADQTYANYFSRFPPGLTEAPEVCRPEGSLPDLGNPDPPLSITYETGT